MVVYKMRPQGNVNTSMYIRREPSNPLPFALGSAAAPL